METISLVKSLADHTVFEQLSRKRNKRYSKSSCPYSMKLDNVGCERIRVVYDDSGCTQSHPVHAGHVSRT